jgi:hypothetical protein
MHFLINLCVKTTGDYVLFSFLFKYFDTVVQTFNQRANINDCNFELSAGMLHVFTENQKDLWYID